MNRESSRSHAVFTMTLESKVGRFNKNLGSSSNQYFTCIYLFVCDHPAENVIASTKFLLSSLYAPISTYKFSRLISIHFLTELCISQKCQLCPSPPPPGYCKALFYLPCQSRVWGISKLCLAWRSGICQPRGYLQAFDTHVVSYPNITMDDFTGIRSRMADWLIC